MISLPGYQISARIYAGTKTQVYRGRRKRDRMPVAIKLLNSEYPGFSQIVQFRNQYTIAKNLDHPGIIRTYSLVPYQNSYALIMEDFGGISLAQYARRQDPGSNDATNPTSHSPLTLAEVLNIALQLVEILHYLIRHRIIHKDIKPGNILIHPDTKQVKLIDFSIASLLPRETQELQNPNVLEGTLAYLSPEQTGRMNRGIDYRTDFYSLGVTLYELLTGQLSFTTPDPIELVHCHIAKQPPLVCRLNPQIPPVLSAIVNRLMAKNAEDRYQSALGLKYDLEQCLNRWDGNGTIQPFDLGQRDIPARFVIPEKLYGREPEVTTLLAAFERVAGEAVGAAGAGAAEAVRIHSSTATPHTPHPTPHTPHARSELMLVAGYSGIGKTAVVNEVHKPILRQRGYFIKGKFDQFQRNLPFSAFLQSFRDLMGQLLSETDAQLQQWRGKILAALGENCQVIIDVIPELERIIGQQPPVPELSGMAAQNRFNLLFQTFIQVFATPQHPLVMFLDDLQWADSASLKLMQLLMSKGETHSLLLIGAYRDNEVSPTHSLVLTLDEIEATGSVVHTITLAPLRQADLNHLIADTFSCSTELALPLTRLIDRKTQGNPFFATQFLKSLYEEGLITFNLEAGYWQCDIAGVKALTLTDDVVEFMALQLQKLPDRTQQILKLAACIGNPFDLSTLAIVNEKSPLETAAELWNALQDGLVLPISEIYKLYQAEGNNDELLLSNRCPDQEQAAIRYRFLHDRVQQAAYALIPDDRKQFTHYKIGQLLLSNTAGTEREEKIFAIANQLNYGIEFIETQAERESLAQVNLLAGCKAKASTAYTSAMQYFQSGIKLLPDNPWQKQYQLTLSLYKLAAETAFLSTDFVQTEQFIQIVFRQALTLLDQVSAYETKIQMYLVQNKMDEAIHTALETLKLLGVPLEPEPANWVVALPDENQLSAIPAMTAPEPLAALKILIALTHAVFVSKPDLFPRVILTMTNLCLHHGHSAMAAFAYSAYGWLMCGVGENVEVGYQAGCLSLTLLERFNARELQCKVFFNFYSMTCPWKQHLKESLAPLREGLQAGLEAGDLESASYCAMFNCFLTFFSGEHLESVEQQQGKSIEQLQNLKADYAIYHASIWRQMSLTLQGKGTNRKQLIGESFNEVEMQSQLEALNNQTSLFSLSVAKTILFYLYGNYDQAVECICARAEFAEAFKGWMMVAQHSFYYCLALLAFYPQAGESEQQQYLKTIEEKQALFQTWATLAPMNYQHKSDLIAAEKARALGQPLNAIALYDRAIAGAKEHGYLQEEALANERAAQFYLAWGRERLAQDYLTDAYYSYARWGARAKVGDLEQRYPQLLASILNQTELPFDPEQTIIAPDTLSQSRLSRSSASSSGASVALDLTAALKASQAISSEIQLDLLLSTLLQVALENAGADKCVLMLLAEQQLTIEAIAQVGQAPVVLQSIPLIDNQRDSQRDSQIVPIRLIHRVKNSLQPIVIIDAGGDATLVADPYIQQHHPKSLLCMPILHQGKLLGILYLENKLAAAAFTNDRVEILNLLCTQAAISLENARLYRLEQEKSQQLQEKAQLMAFRAAVDSTVTQGTMLQVMLQRCAQEIVNYLDAAFARIWVLNDCEDILELQASAGLYTDIGGPHGRVRVGQSQIGLIAEERLPYFTNRLIRTLEWKPPGEGLPLQVSDRSNEVQQDPHVRDRAWAEREGLVAFAGYPLIVKDQLLGVVALFTRYPLTDAILDVLGSVADKIALGIQRQQTEIALRASEARLQQKTQELEQALQELQNAQLQTVQQEKMASLGNLVAGVAHEINNPVGCIAGNLPSTQDYLQDLLGLIELYQQKYPQPDADIQAEMAAVDLEFLRQDAPKLIASMQAGIHRIKNISTSLRTFSRADKDYKVPFNLHEGIDSTLLILRHRIKANGTRPTIDVIRDYGNLSDIKCYPGQLNQVFMNLIANALDALDEASQGRSYAEIVADPNRITIQTLQKDDRALVRIRDNGLGMTEAVSTRIFESSFTTKAVGKGTGLGLAIARQIIEEKHSGRLTCHSQIAQGTEFEIQIPVQ